MIIKNMIAVSTAIQKILALIDQALEDSGLLQGPDFIQKRVELNDKLRSVKSLDEAKDAILSLGPFAQDNLCLSRHNEEILPLIDEAVKDAETAFATVVDVVNTITTPAPEDSE